MPGAASCHGAPCRLAMCTPCSGMRTPEDVVACFAALTRAFIYHVCACVCACVHADGFKYSGVVENEGTFIARNSLFKKNRASFGAGVVWTKPYKVFEAYGCEFDSNAGAWGTAIGGVALVDANGRFTAENCLFVRNTAGTTGGVVHVKAEGKSKSEDPPLCRESAQGG